MKHSFIETNGCKIWKIENLAHDLPEKKRLDAVMSSAALAISGGDMAKYESLVSGKLPSLDEAILSVDFGKSAYTAASLILAGNLGRVLVYGDYDADGVCSTALAIEMCKNRCDSVSFFVPDRYGQGYGLHADVAERMKDSFDTLIVVDCGTQNFDTLEELSKSGKKVVVFDHHEQGNSPKHSVVVNLKGGNPEGTPGSEMCAAGLVWSWATKFGVLSPKRVLETSWLAAVATVADCMNLTELNRRIVATGLEVMTTTPPPQMELLMNLNGIERLKGSGRYPVSSTDIAMKLAPCINAAGRLEHADIAVRAMSGQDGFVYEVDRLVELNEKRKDVSKRIVAEAKERFHSEDGVMKGEWEVGVTSGAAGSLCTSEGRPVALAVELENHIHTTTRAPEGGDVLKCLSNISDLLTSWGGHKRAAGFSCKKENWKEVSERLREEFAAMEITPPTKAAFEIPAGFLTPDVWREVETRFGPFGQGNPSPAVYLKNDGNARVDPLGKGGEHFKVIAGAGEILAFWCSDPEGLANADGWLCEPGVSSWKGREKLQMVLAKNVVEEPTLDAGVGTEMSA